MNPLPAFVALVVGLPLLYAMLLGLRARRRRRQAPSHRSVAVIAARIKQERAVRNREVRWPRADPDHGLIRDDRPTRRLRPVPPRSRQPHERP